MSRWHTKVKAPEMEKDAKPTLLVERFFPGTAGLPSVSKHRAVDCEIYDQCLTFACARDWQNWSCRACPRFRAGEAEGAGSLMPCHVTERMDAAAGDV